jgi:hypothetical protein
MLKKELMLKPKRSKTKLTSSSKLLIPRRLLRMLIKLLPRKLRIEPRRTPRRLPLKRKLPT